MAVAVFVPSGRSDAYFFKFSEDLEDNPIENPFDANSLATGHVRSGAAKMMEVLLTCSGDLGTSTDDE